MPCHTNGLKSAIQTQAINHVNCYKYYGNNKNIFDIDN